MTLEVIYIYFNVIRLISVKFEPNQNRLIQSWPLTLDDLKVQSTYNVIRIIPVKFEPGQSI